MGIKSVINADRLYWLGRYSERVYTTIKLFSVSFDGLIEQFGDDHAAFCESLEIPNIYSDKDDFIDKYAFSSEDPNSIVSNLTRAHDNAIELREEIGSEALSFIQMSVYEMQRAKVSDNPVYYMQKATDYLLAFWGIIDDQIDDENTRNIIKVGKRVERLDLCARLHREPTAIAREARRLAARIQRTDLLYNRASIENLQKLSASETLDYPAIIAEAERILAV